MAEETVVPTTEEENISLDRVDEILKELATEKAHYTARKEQRDMAVLNLMADFSDVETRVAKIKSLEEELEKFSLKDRDIWEEGKLLLNNGTLIFKKTPPALEVVSDAKELTNKLKEYFKNLKKEDEYLKYIRVKLEADKVALKKGIAAGDFTEEFMKEAGLIMKPGEKFTYEIANAVILSVLPLESKPDVTEATTSVLDAAKTPTVKLSKRKPGR